MFKKNLKYLIGVAIMFIIPLIIHLAGGYWMQILFMVGIFGILAVSLNLILGYTGQMNLAHAVLFGAGGYTSGLLVMRLHINFWLTVPLAGITALILALIFGYITLRLRGTYFALSTMAFSVMMLAVYNNLTKITGGTYGLMPIPAAKIGSLVLGPSQRLLWVYIVFAFLLLTMFIVHRILHSRVGLAFTVIRENEDLARSSGVNTFWYKMLSFGISAFFAGVAGSLYATYQGMMSPADCTNTVFFVILVACAVGGLGTLIGPVIGAAIALFVPEILKGWSESLYYLIFGALLIVVIVFAPRGLMGAIETLYNRITTARAPKKEVKAEI